MENKTTRQGDENFDMPSDKVMGYKEIITQRLNMWRIKHVERVVMYHDAVQRRKVDPTAVLIVGMNQATGQNVEKSITRIVEERLPAAIESKYHVSVLEAMLKEIEKGEDELAKRWDNDGLALPEDMRIKSPIAGEMRKEGGAEEGSKV